jgi:hypothetical protein
MGGDALKQLFNNLSIEKKVELLALTNSVTNVEQLVCRITQDIYVDLKDTIKSKCNAIGLDISFLREFSDKIDHGDLDILYYDRTVDIRNIINELFQPVAIMRNGTITSFAYKYSDEMYFQIDFIFVKDLEMSTFFFSFGDIGMSLGIISSRHNLKFGDSGLFLKCNGEVMNNIFGTTDFKPEEVIEFELSTSPSEICEFFELDYQQWLTQFDTMNEAYEWLSKCKFFDPKYFIHGLDMKKRHEKPKRKFMNGFEEFCETNKELVSKDFGTNLSRVDFSRGVLYTFNKFQKFDDYGNILIKKRRVEKERSDKFSGKDIMEKRIYGKQIGEILLKFKLYIVETRSKTFEEWLDAYDKESVLMAFDFFFESLNF